MIALSHDGVFMLICQMGFIQTNVVLVGWRQRSLKGLRGIISAPDTLVRIVSCVLTVASCTTPSALVGKGYSLCTVNGDAGFNGTTMVKPFGVMYDDRVE